jgi:alcohol dehydrogenase (cytochrome c)
LALSQATPSGGYRSHEVNRRVALYGDKVYYAAGEAVLVALDARTGAEVWTTTVADNKAGYYITLAPLVAGGKVMVGASGGEYGIRGFVAAFDAENGKELWRTFTVPAPGEPGSETWPKGDQWKTGGAPAGNYDYLWFLERSAGPIKFVEGKPYVFSNVIGGVDPAL